jgi:hypothetical protein
MLGVTGVGLGALVIGVSLLRRSADLAALGIAASGGVLGFAGTFLPVGKRRVGKPLVIVGVLALLSGLGYLAVRLLDEGISGRPSESPAWPITVILAIAAGLLIAGIIIRYGLPGLIFLNFVAIGGGLWLLWYGGRENLLGGWAGTSLLLLLLASIAALMIGARVPAASLPHSNEGVHRMGK